MEPSELKKLQDDPRQLIEFMAKSLGKKLNQTMLDAMAADLTERLALDGQPATGRGNKKQRRKR